MLNRDEIKEIINRPDFYNKYLEIINKNGKEAMDKLIQSHIENNMIDNDYYSDKLSTLIKLKNYINERIAARERYQSRISALSELTALSTNQVSINKFYSEKKAAEHELEKLEMEEEVIKRYEMLGLMTSENIKNRLKPYIPAIIDNKKNFLGDATDVPIDAKISTTNIDQILPLIFPEDNTFLTKNTLYAVVPFFDNEKKETSYAGLYIPNNKGEWEKDRNTYLDTMMSTGNIRYRLQEAVYADDKTRSINHITLKLYTDRGAEIHDIETIAYNTETIYQEAVFLRALYRNIQETYVKDRESVLPEYIVNRYSKPYNINRQTDLKNANNKLKEDIIDICLDLKITDTQLRDLSDEIENVLITADSNINMSDVIDDIQQKLKNRARIEFLQGNVDSYTSQFVDDHTFSEYMLNESEEHDIEDDEDEHEDDYEM